MNPEHHYLRIFATVIFALCYFSLRTNSTSKEFTCFHTIERNLTLEFHTHSLWIDIYYWVENHTLAVGYQFFGDVVGDCLCLFKSDFLFWSYSLFFGISATNPFLFSNFSVCEEIGRNHYCLIRNSSIKSAVGEPARGLFKSRPWRIMEVKFRIQQWRHRSKHKSRGVLLGG